jgi:F-type H+-transporting ATPase subunit epsilon
MANFKLAVLTPRGLIFDGDVSSMVARGSEGQLGVLAGHAPMIVSTIPGVLKISAESDRYFAAGTGLLEVSEDGVKLLSDQVTECDSHDAAAEAAKAINPA